MKTIPTTRLAVLCAVIAVALLTFGSRASALTVGDSHELGFLSPSMLLGNQDRAAYVNHLVGMALGSSDIANGQKYVRSHNAFTPMPNAVAALSGTGSKIDLGGGSTYAYLFASYNGYGSEVWFVGNMSGIITIPKLTNGHALTQWTLFGPGVPGVPDGGTTAMLLGAALSALGVARRFLLS